jgi:hypothetical protein
MLVHANDEHVLVEGKTQAGTKLGGWIKVA